jgi:hypothetical protein
LIKKLSIVKIAQLFAERNGLMSNYIKIIEDFLKNDIDIIRNSKGHLLQKFLALPSVPSNDESKEFYTVCRALEFMENSDENTKSFLKNKRHDLIFGDSKSQSATLAEIIAYYCLVEAGFYVEYQETSQNPSADFIVTDPQGEKAIIEVRCRLLCDEAIKEMNAVDTNLEEKIQEVQKKGGGVVFGEPKIIRPYGYSKDSCTADAISKICSMKQEEHQMSDTLPSILWADFGVTGDFSTTGDLFYPLNSWKGALTSGHFWYAFYGKKDYPIYTDYSKYDELNVSHGSIEKMQHNGRFNQNTKLSGCLLRCSQNCFFYEHPNPMQPISDCFRKRLLNLPHFSIEKSLVNFYPNMVKEQNTILEKYIEAFSQL